MSAQKTQLAVIGAGPGGYAAAFMAADLGLEVTLIDPEENPGGVCLYRGCIPSKTLLHAARMITECHKAKQWGLDFKGLSVDIPTLRQWKNSVVTALTSGLGQLVRHRKIDHIRGQAVFADKNQLKIQDVKGKTHMLVFDYAIIATGSKAAKFSLFDGIEKQVWYSSSALNLSRIPKRLLIVGGGYIGLELGSVYAALGSGVSLVEMTAGLLPGVDRDLVRLLTSRVESNFDSIYLQSAVTAVKAQKNGCMVSIKNADGKLVRHLFDQILVAVGRRPGLPELDWKHSVSALIRRGLSRWTINAEPICPIFSLLAM